MYLQAEVDSGWLTTRVSVGSPVDMWDGGCLDRLLVVGGVARLGGGCIRFIPVVWAALAPGDAWEKLHESAVSLGLLRGRLLSGDMLAESEVRRTPLVLLTSQVTEVSMVCRIF